MTNREWMGQAACRGKDPEMFFPDARGVHVRKQIATAARVCADCPVITECAQYRDATGSAFGIWGGAIIRTQSYGATRGRPPLIHGTESMYKRHLRYGQTPCHACREASRRARQSRYLTERQAN